jgi:hypothetical protein
MHRLKQGLVHAGLPTYASASEILHDLKGQAKSHALFVATKR